jgi:MOSC domain-containing protein YiiM
MHRTSGELDGSLEVVRDAPADHGTVALIVRRPAVGEREILAEGVLDERVGLVGDTWSDRPSRHSDDGGPHPLMQLNVMSARVVSVLSDDPATQALAGDQLYLDLDLSHANLPVGTRLALGEAVIEVTDRPHNGCAKFADRFGTDAVRWVNSPEGKQLRLRGLNARVVTGGRVRTGDPVRPLR